MRKARANTGSVVVNDTTAGLTVTNLTTVKGANNTAKQVIGNLCLEQMLVCA